MPRRLPDIAPCRLCCIEIRTQASAKKNIKTRDTLCAISSGHSHAAEKTNAKTDECLTHIYGKYVIEIVPVRTSTSQYFKFVIKQAQSGPIESEFCFINVARALHFSKQFIDDGLPDDWWPK